MQFVVGNKVLTVHLYWYSRLSNHEFVAYIALYNDRFKALRYVKHGNREGGDFIIIILWNVTETKQKCLVLLVGIFLNMLASKSHSVVLFRLYCWAVMALSDHSFASRRMISEKMPV